MNPNLFRYDDDFLPTMLNYEAKNMNLYFSEEIKYFHKQNVEGTEPKNYAPKNVFPIRKFGFFLLSFTSSDGRCHYLLLFYKHQKF